MKEMPHFSQPKGYENLSWDPDAIPGITSFIFNENRYRKEHEFIGYDDGIEKAKEELKKLGITTTGSVWDILDELKKYKSEYDETAKELETIQLEKEKQDDMLVTLKEDLTKQIKSANLAWENRKSIEKKIHDYGDHTENCNYIGIIAIGRKVDEGKACSCGWYTIKTENKV